MHKIRSKWQSIKKRGFTIVELLVVIAIIGVLATISIVGYSAWRQTTAATQVKNDLNALSSAMETYRTFNNGYPALSTDIASTFTANSDVTITYTLLSQTVYCVDAVSNGFSSITYYLTSETKEQGPLPGTCATRPSSNPPEVPTGLAVGTTTTNSVQLSWSVASYAVTYLAECSTDIGFINNVKQATTGGLSTILTGLNTVTQYFCHVRAVNSLGSSAWSTTVTATTITPASTYTSIVAAPYGPNSAYGLKSDGSVWAWGSNSFGQVGNNSTTSQLTPTQVISSGVVEIYPASNSVYVRKSDGSLWAWGMNNYGQVGVNSTTSQLAPKIVMSSGVSQIEGDSTLYARKSDGSVWAWGYNLNGQVGNNTTVHQLSPVQVMASGAADIVMGQSSVYVRKTDGSLWAWGSNSYGQVGNNSSTNQLTPVQVISSGVADVTTNGGYGTVYVHKTDGSLWAWGYNLNGRVGNNSTANQLTPVQIIASGAADVGVSTGQGTAYVRKTDGSLWAWGANSNGSVGNNSTTNQLTPVQVIASGVTFIRTGSGNPYVRKSDGTVWSWGYNATGAVGNNSTTNQLTPVQVLTGSVANIWAYLYSVYVIKTDGTLWAWGGNNSGRLGNGGTTAQLTPVQTLSGGVAQVALPSENTGYARKIDGTIYGWGANTAGQVGNNSTSTQLTPVQIP